MKPVLTALIAATVFGLSLGLPDTATAIGPGYVAPKDPVVPRGPWEARVRRVDPHTDPVSGVHYTFTYTTITGPTQESCDQQLSAVLANPGVTVVDPCHPA